MPATFDGSTVTGGGLPLQTLLLTGGSGRFSRRHRAVRVLHDGVAAMNSRTVYRIGSFVVDPDRREVRKGTDAIALSRQAVAVVAHLARKHPHCVTHDELLAAAWLGVVVGGGSLRLAIWEARKALSTDPNLRDAIETVRGKGYRFVAQVERGTRDTNRSRCDELFGRADELSRLTEMLEQSIGSKGRACAITGPSGIGKTRLLRELAERAQEHELVVLEGRGEPDRGAPALWPWVQMLEAQLDAADESTRKHCERATPRVFRLFEKGPSVTARQDAEPLAPNARFMLLTEFARWIVLSSARKPMLLLFDDLHCADADSLDMFAHVARELRKSRALLVVACRQPLKGESKGTERALEALSQEPLNQCMPLRPLTHADVEELLTEQLGEPVSSTLAERVHQITGGNPRLARELVPVLAEERSAERALPAHGQRSSARNVSDDGFATNRSSGSEARFLSRWLAEPRGRKRRTRGVR